MIGADELAQARFARRQRMAAEETSDEASRAGEGIARLEQAQDELFARREAGEVIPDRIYNQRMRSFEAEIARLKRAREKALRAAALSQRATRRLIDELAGDGPFTDEQWYSLSAARRRDFLRLLFPYGLPVDPAEPHVRRGEITGRLRVRDEREANAAEQRRMAPVSDPGLVSGALSG